MEFNLKNNFKISEMREDDKTSLLKHLSEKQISDQTLHIPYPYTSDDADRWIQYTKDEKEVMGRTLNFVIRNPEGQLIGGIGIAGLIKNHRAEVGYWLAKPYWGQGIMGDAVRVFTDFMLNELGLVRITAHIFDFNIASEKLLRKNGFEQEGFLRKHYLKNGQYCDCKLFAKVKSI